MIDDGDSLPMVEMVSATIQLLRGDQCAYICSMYFAFFKLHQRF